jgi:hypothetical protein
MDVYHQIPLILEWPFLSTIGATIDVAARIIKLNISGIEETVTFKTMVLNNATKSWSRSDWSEML